MSAKRTKLLDLLVKHLSSSEDSEHNLTAQLDRDALTRLVFKGLSRNSKPFQGLRLTHMGNKLLSAFFDNWTIQLPEGSEIKTLHLNQLDRLLDTPWNLTQENITLYDPNYAMKLKLINGDLDHFVKWLKK